MALPSNLKFSCSALPTINGHTLKAHKADAEGFYDVVVGAIGIPTRLGVIYDPESLIKSMNDPASRFNITLKDGNLHGEYGHPEYRSKDDINRLLTISQDRISHYFKKIWIDEAPTMLNGQEGHLIRAKVKPTGEKGEYLKQQLEDPTHNTAFSIRSLCIPVTGPEPSYSYRKVQVVVTFDAVDAPGYEPASKRYVSGNESFESDVSIRELTEASSNIIGMENCMITDADIRRLSSNDLYRVNNHVVALNTVGKHSLVDIDGNLIDAASLMYSRRN